MTRLHKWLLASAAIAAASAAIASETITYSYDARGRLTKVVHSGSVNSGVATSYSYDKADNRTGKTTTGAAAGLMAGAATADPVPQGADRVGESGASVASLSQDEPPSFKPDSGPGRRR